MDNAIQAADERLVYLSGDEDAIRAYERRAKALSDWTSAYNYATETGYAEGHETGMAKGVEKGTLEIARKMKAAGLLVTEIERFTGLSSEVIEQL